MKTYFKFVSLVAVIASLLFIVPTNKAAQRRGRHTAADHVHRRAAKVRKRVRKQAVNYVCPMHPDMRSKSRGERAKCGMDLVRKRKSRDRAVVLFR
ncbi:MAG TPA: heavy metal-binding domain-containing protein [Pyrinomonadaceae bacterium]|nr:heavy metal-binding domain-containing protein [Pyrinomonadaceae bacterium]